MTRNVSAFVWLTEVVSSNADMLSSVAFVRWPGSSSSLTKKVSSPLVSSLLCFLVPLLIWTVAVVGIHHVHISTHSLLLMAENAYHPFLEENSSGSSSKETAAPEFWHPGEERNSVSSGSSQATTTALLPPDHNHEEALVGLWPAQDYRMDWSTEENYRVPLVVQHQNNVEPQSFFCGTFADIRYQLDHGYHKFYNCQRQLFQDTIIEEKLEWTKETTKDKGTSWASCDDARQSAGGGNRRHHWIVFTAGVMGAFHIVDNKAHLRFVFASECLTYFYFFTSRCWQELYDSATP